MHITTAATVNIASSESEIEACYPVLRELRPTLGANEFKRRVQLQTREGYRLAFIELDGQVAAAAGFRIIHLLASGKTMYVDDLVTAQTARSKGLGRTLLAWLKNFAREQDCDIFSLDSGVQRQRAHSFYFREGLTIVDFHFEVALKKGDTNG